MHTGAALVASLCVMAISLFGVVFAGGALQTFIKKYMTYLGTFSAGVFLIVAWHLAGEAINDGGWLVGIGSVLLGALIMEAVHFLSPSEHHHHGEHDHAHTSIDGRRVLLSDGLHNIGDGILLVGAFAADWYVGVAATVGVLLHEAVQEISEYFVLREAGYSHSGALLRNFLVSGTILIGIFFAGALSSFEIILALLSGIAAGGFLSVVLHDLLPHAVHSVRTNGGTYVHVLAGLLGGAAMFGIQAMFPHEEVQVLPVEEVPTTEIIIDEAVAAPNVPLETDISSSPPDTLGTFERQEEIITTPTEEAIEPPGETSDGAAGGTGGSIPQ